MMADEPSRAAAGNRIAHGLRYVPRPDTALVQGEEDSPRRITIDFDGFVERVSAAQEPDHERLSRLMAGADLIIGMESPYNEGFAMASPTVAADAPLSQQFSAITDEAFDSAETLMHYVPTFDDLGEPHMDPAMHGPELALAINQLVNGNFVHTVRHALLNAPASADPAVGAEFI